MESRSGSASAAVAPKTHTKQRANEDHGAARATESRDSALQIVVELVEPTEMAVEPTEMAVESTEMVVESTKMAVERTE